MAGSSWRIIAQRLLTGEFLSWDVPLSGATRTRELSGPGGVSGRIAPELRSMIADDGRPLIEEWSTALYYEEAGLIRAGGIVQSVAADVATQSLILDAPGFASYPVGVPLVTDYVPGDFEDPIVVFKNLWDHMQAFPDGNLGVTVRDSGGSYMVLSGGAGPYKAIGWEYRDYGTELNNIAQACSFDYEERHAWNADHTAITHNLEVGFPRLGRKRDDLRFAQDENIVSFSHVGADGTLFSQEVHVLGAGEGSTQIVSVNAVRDGRLRRPVVVSRKADTQFVADMYSYQERIRRNLLVDIPEVQVMDHPNAPISAIQPGDDISTMVDVPFYGELRLWLRVLSIEESVDNPDRVTLKTQRSDLFTYAASSNPNSDGSPVVITV